MHRRRPRYCSGNRVNIAAINIFTPPFSKFMSQATPIRSLAKTLTWRIVATTDTFLLTYFSATFMGADLGITTQQATGLAATVAGLELITKIVLYYIHERGMGAIQMGNG